ncbi:MAG: MFS transporter [Candidatus Lokiarchaeota archaeon]|nr:MFS transporter [Candidatus Lokiarchaeota archaeon]
MSDPHIPQPPAIMEHAGSRRYRFWAVYAAAFTRTLSYSIYGVALPNYLIYFLHVPPELLGVIISVYATAYIAGPLVALPITRRIGARNGTMLSVAGSILLVGCQLIFLDPVILVVLRGIDGFLLGFFWPNLQMEVSSWQRAIPEKGDGQFFQAYGMSWNTGIILGNIGGMFIVVLGAGNEYLALVIAWLAMMAMIPCCLAMERPGTSITLRGGTYLAVTATRVVTTRVGRAMKAQTTIPTAPVHPLSPATRYLLSFPAAFYFASTLVYAYIKAFYPIIYPLALNEAGIPSFIVYLVTFIHQAVQAIVIAIWTRRSVQLNHRTWIIAMAANIAFFAWLWGSPEPMLLSVAFAVNGVLSGWLYTFTSKIMLEYGAVRNSLKYATYYEFFNGIGFGMAPLIAGAAASFGPAVNFAIMTLLVSGSSVVLFITSARAASRRNADPRESLNAP